MSGAAIMEDVQLSLDLAKLGGLKDIVATPEVISTQFKPVPTKP
jgi:NitT/TauT family transport system substrate-binding protein